MKGAGKEFKRSTAPLNKYKPLSNDNSQIQIKYLFERGRGECRKT
jgi:hypothetical protein